MNLKITLIKFWNFNPIFFTSVIVIVLLSVLTNFVHEFGHILICMINGNDFVVSFNLLQIALQTDCPDLKDNISWYWVFGGMFGIVSSVWLLLIKKFRINKGLFIGVVVVAFDHFLKMVFETLPATHAVYLNSLVFKMYLGVIVAFLWIGLLVFFIKRTKQKSQSN